MYLPPVTHELPDTQWQPLTSIPYLIYCLFITLIAITNDMVIGCLHPCHIVTYLIFIRTPRGNHEYYFRFTVCDAQTEFNRI